MYSGSKTVILKRTVVLKQLYSNVQWF